MIVEENYLPEQTFSMYETSLFWKGVPERTFIHKEARPISGFIALKEKITNGLGSKVQATN